MNTNARSRRRQEILVLSVLAFLSLAIFFLILRLEGVWLLALAGIGGIVVLAGWLHYFVWSRRQQRRSAQRLNLDEADAEPWDAHRFDDLPPAIRKRMAGDFYLPADRKPPL